MTDTALAIDAALPSLIDLIADAQEADVFARQREADADGEVATRKPMKLSPTMTMGLALDMTYGEWCGMDSLDD